MSAAKASSQSITNQTIVAPAVHVKHGREPRTGAVVRLDGNCNCKCNCNRNCKCNCKCNCKASNADERGHIRGTSTDRSMWRYDSVRNEPFFLGTPLGTLMVVSEQSCSF
jgi:hypothetical protein